MSAPTVAVVIQVTRMTGLKGETHPVPGLPIGMLAVGGLDEAGATITFDSPEACARMVGELHQVLTGMRQVEHRQQQERVWAEQPGRRLHAVEAPLDRRVGHPSLLGGAS